MQTQVIKRDKQRVNHVTITGLLLYNHLRKGFQRTHSITEPRFTMLLLMAEYYFKTGLGLTVYGLSKVINPVNYGTGEVTNTQYKINRLLHDDLVEVSGYGSWNAKAYIPTQRVLKELQAMCDAVNNG